MAKIGLPTYVLGFHFILYLSMNERTFSSSEVPVTLHLLFM